ncbi:MAG TPA: Smr/MutS family protein [Bacteroidales bacterium]|nr:Smr/MutS family protein [Bacteroidales bacterium]HRZ50009.1 Smr/MutS family protein [Bacteroidales bacterium]
MIFPEGFEQKIGFDRVREMLLQACRNPMSRTLVAEMAFSPEHAEVTLRTGMVHEYVRVLSEVYGHPDGVVDDYIWLPERIRIPGSWFEPEHLPGFHDALRAIEDYLLFFRHHTAAPLLAGLSRDITVDAQMITSIGALLNQQGEIRDDATPELATIRRELNLARARSERVLKKVLRESIASGVLPKDTDYTVKDGRFVIPVPAARKRQIRGYVHDESATGQTCYIEPAEMVELSNEIRELELAERREIIRIMVGVADLIRPSAPELHAAFRYAGKLDFIRAKARLALQIRAVLPQIEDRPVIGWRNAVHPLLYLAFREQKREVVPLSLSLNTSDRILVISGPNAGGKSVCLKTAGLLQYMLQCGLLIPVDPNSTAGIFSGLFIDIGDEQSIENDLSTYSSHLVNLNKLLQVAGSGLLFLIDEMGSGTEPESGGAIAEAALEALAATGAMGIVTTHYANLKGLAGVVPGILNGAMLFDTNHMKPMFRLKTGKPGSSFAFEIAARTGLPDALLEKAKDKVGRARFEFEYQIQQFETEKEALEKKKQEMQVADAFLAEMLAKYTALYEKLEASRKEVLQQAKAEAKGILSDANRMIEKTIREIRESEAQKESVKAAREALRKDAAELTESEPQPVPVPARDHAIRIEKKRKTQQAQEEVLKMKQKKLEPGDFVRMKGHTSPGQIIRLDGTKALVAFDNLKIEVPTEQLERSAPPAKQNRNIAVHTDVLKDLRNRSENFKPGIDVRGKRAEEVLTEVSRLIDDAIWLNIKELSILHGKGDGILRKVIRDFLAGVPQVLSFSDAHIEQGGHGITRIILK